MIDVRELIRERSIDELNRAAEQYFAVLDDHTYLLAKPFDAVDECPRLLMSFAALLQGLYLTRGMSVLDLGAGACWTSHLLTQLGCKAYAVDVSESALRIGQELYASHPPFGSQPEAEFLVYDGRRLPLPDQSVDRVICFDSFHHVPNPERLIHEIYRVLQADGVAGFSEPGPNHSQTPGSQMEMEKHTVIENDIVVGEIWAWARNAGFKRLALTPMTLAPPQVTLEDYDAFLAGRDSIDQALLQSVRTYAKINRLFFMSKQEMPERNSRTRGNLIADLRVILDEERSYRQGDWIDARLEVTNISPAVWLPVSAGIGAVNLGCHLLDCRTGKSSHDYARAALTPDPGDAIRPGQTVSTAFSFPAPAAGSYELIFDLVSEGVCWFEENGSKAVKLRLEIA